MPVPLVRSFLICTFAAACVLPASPASAFCSRPIAPYCVADGNLSDEYVPEERCRRNVIDHMEDLTRYRSCLTAEIGEIDAAVERFRSLLGEAEEKSRTLPAAPATPDAPATAAAG